MPILILILVSSNADTLPPVAYRSPETETAYRVVLDTPALISRFRCICGCMEDTRNHGSLLFCYRNSDGSWNEHAADCPGCVGSAVAVAEWLAERFDFPRMKEEFDKRFPPGRWPDA